MNTFTRKLTLVPIISFFVASAMNASAVNPAGMSACSMTTSAAVSMVFTGEEVDELPSFPGGETARLNFINATRRYPAEDYQNGVQGRVVCSFIVNSDGSISDAAVIRGVSTSLDIEALRVINAMPRWVAGRLDGVCVPVYQVMSISFRL